MVKVLILSDLHDNAVAFKRILRAVRFDFLILAGDICDFRCKEFFQIMRIVNKPIIIVPGNHDCVPCYEVMKERIRDFYVLKNDIIVFSLGNLKLIIAGLSGIYSKKRRDMHHITSADIVILANKILKLGRHIDILITHDCAKQCSDIIPYTKGARGGVRDFYLLHLIGSPRIHICGHMHYPLIEKFRNTICLNPGMGFLGFYAILDLNTWDARIFRLSFKYDFVKEHRTVYTYNWIKNVKRSYYRILNAEARELGDK